MNCEMQEAGLDGHGPDPAGLLFYLHKTLDHCVMSTSSLSIKQTEVLLPWSLVLQGETGVLLLVLQAA